MHVSGYNHFRLQGDVHFIAANIFDETALSILRATHLPPVHVQFRVSYDGKEGHLAMCGISEPCEAVVALADSVRQRTPSSQAVSDQDYRYISIHST
jgi:hypothetical protein